jgi:hypothetical protein
MGPCLNTTPGEKSLFVRVHHPYSTTGGGFYLPWFGMGNWYWNWTTCPKCMAVVRTESNYCGYCGDRLPQVAQPESTICGVCGSKIPTSANFCPQCGEGTRDPKRLKTRMRFSWLKDVERRYSSDNTLFRAGGLPDAEDDKEEPVFDKARKKAKDTNEPVMVNVILREKRGEIGSLPWALIEPDGTIEYVYP